MSFQQDLTQPRDDLLRLVDAGVPVRDAARSLQVSLWRAYEMLRACGRGSGPKTVVTDAHRVEVLAAFAASGSINRAAIAAGLSHNAARRILVAAGVVPAAPRPRGKATEKARFLELVAAGWSVARAAREVGVNERSGRDWRAGVRKSRSRRIYPCGAVVDSATGTRYTTTMTRTDATISDRYLSLQDRLAIADGLITGLTLTAIAAGIGKHTSTVSREVATAASRGCICPTEPQEVAAAATGTAQDRPNWCTNRVARRGRAGGWSGGCPPSRSRHTAASRTSPTTRACA